MKKFAFVVTLITACVISVACAGDSQKGASGDWASYFVIWEGNMYNVTEEIIAEVEDSIGVVEEYSDIEGTIFSSKVFSNKYPVGTKLYKIKNISIDEAIAIEYEGSFTKAINAGKYGG